MEWNDIETEFVATVAKGYILFFFKRYTLFGQEKSVGVAFEHRLNEKTKPQDVWRAHRWVIDAQKVALNHRQGRTPKRQHNQVPDWAPQRPHRICQLQWQVIYSGHEPDRRCHLINAQLLKRRLTPIVLSHIRQLIVTGLLGLRGHHEIPSVGACVRAGPIRAKGNATKTGETHGLVCARGLSEDHRLRVGSHYLFAVLHYYFAIQHPQIVFQDHSRHVLTWWLKSSPFAHYTHAQTQRRHYFIIYRRRLTHELLQEANDPWDVWKATKR